MAASSANAADRPPPTTVTPEAKNANTGTATPADSGRIRCSNRWATSVWPEWLLRLDTRSFGRTGTTRARSTPATVACTPEAWTSAQVRAASGTRAHQRVIRCWTSQAKAASGASATSSGTGCSSLV